jgi:hypothetical protein
MHKPTLPATPSAVAYLPTSNTAPVKQRKTRNLPHGTLDAATASAR